MRRVWLLNSLIVGAAVAVFVTLEHGLHPARGGDWPWWLLAILFAVADRCVVHMHFRESAHSFSLADIPLVLGLIFATPQNVLLGLVAGSLGVIAFERRLPPIKIVFNIGQYLLAAALAIAIFHVIAGAHPSMDPRLWLAIIAAVQVSGTVTALLIATVITITEGGLDLGGVLRMLGMDAAVGLTNTALALGIAVVVDTQPLATPLLVLPAATVFIAYRAYLSERARHERLEFVYETTRTLASSPDVDTALQELLARSLEAFHVASAEVVLFPPDGQLPLRTVLTADGVQETMQPIDSELAAALGRLVGPERPVVDLAHVALEPVLAEHFARRGVQDGLLALLPGDERTVGTVLLANRQGVARRFELDEKRLLEALAGNASVALQNDHLEQVVWELNALREKLEHQAYHDALTALPNRVLFVRRAEQALADPHKLPAVLFLDVDDFKVVNDTLGHAAGDQLLETVARRVQACVRESDVVARFGGDEFAVLMPDAGSGGREATTVAHRVIEAFATPLVLDGQETKVHVSVGLTTAERTREVEQLMRDADVAMYGAKQAGKNRLELFDPRLRHAATRRRTLSEELDDALARGELSLHYQPIFDLETGVPVAVEALVRWLHPELGTISPGEFIAVAEERGSIVALGRFVLDRACRDVADWIRRHPELRSLAVHVNVSPAELRQANLPATMAATVREAGLDPWSVVLELTERMIVEDEATSAELARLRERGFRLALDDFGTGFSALSCLQTLPLDIIKIARPLVDGLDRERGEEVLSAVLGLIDRLDLGVVAEGIETSKQLDALRALGAALGQGYHLGHPMPADDCVRLLMATTVDLTPETTRSSL